MLVCVFVCFLLLTRRLLLFPDIRKVVVVLYIYVAGTFWYYVALYRGVTATPLLLDPLRRSDVTTNSPPLPHDPFWRSDWKSFPSLNGPLWRSDVTLPFPPPDPVWRSTVYLPPSRPLLEE